MDRDRVRIEIWRIEQELDAHTAARSIGAWLCMLRLQSRRNLANFEMQRIEKEPKKYNSINSGYFTRRLHELCLRGTTKHYKNLCFD